jgi:hypothetical protein
MKNKFVCCVLNLPFLLILLTACQAQPTPVYVEGVLRDEISAVVAPFAENIFFGIARNDYAKFGQDFDAAMQTAMTKEQFAKIVKLYGGYGEPLSIEMINIDDRGDYFGINYKVTFDKKVVIMLIVIPKTEPRLVTGLWFN